MAEWNDNEENWICPIFKSQRKISLEKTFQYMRLFCSVLFYLLFLLLFFDALFQFVCSKWLFYINSRVSQIGDFKSMIMKERAERAKERQEDEVGILQKLSHSRRKMYEAAPFFFLSFFFFLFRSRFRRLDERFNEMRLRSNMLSSINSKKYT